MHFSSGVDMEAGIRRLAADTVPNKTCEMSAHGLVYRTAKDRFGSMH